MSDRIVIRIRIKEYVKRWATSVFGPEPITVVCNIPTGQTSLFDLLPLPNPDNSSPDPKIEVSISRRALAEFDEDVRKTGKYLHQQFYLSLFMWTVSQKSTGVPADHGMKSFLNQFDIDEDTLSLETVRKMYQLWKARTKFKLTA